MGIYNYDPLLFTYEKMDVVGPDRINSNNPCIGNKIIVEKLFLLTCMGWQLKDKNNMCYRSK